jgi:hypothetical protein
MSLFLLAAFSPLTAQGPAEKLRVPKVIATQNDWTASPQELFAPYWTLEPGWSTELELRNNVPWHDLRITPVLRNTDGTEISLAPVTLKPEEIVSVNLQNAVASAKPELLGKMGAFGSVLFRFEGTAPGNGFAAAVVRREGHPIDFHFDAESGGSTAAEGIWWFPTPTSTDYLILSNPTSKPVSGELVLTEISGAIQRLSLTVGPRQTVRTDIREVLRVPTKGAFGGLSFSTGKGGGLTATEIVFDEVSGLATIMKLFDRQSIAEADTVESRVLRAPMMALTQPDHGLGFPVGTLLDPEIFLRNASTASVIVSPRVDWRNGGASGTAPLPTVALQPGQMKIVKLADFENAGQIPADASWATVTLGYSGRSADIVAVATSYDKTNRYGLQTPFSETMNRLFKGSMWHVDDSHNTLITTGNGGTEATRAQVTIFYNGGQGKYRVEKRLVPGQQTWLDIGDLLRNQLPDSDGQTIPSDVMFGSYELRDLDHPILGLLYEGKLVVDKTYGHASYGCAHCCGYSSAKLTPSPFTGPPNIDNLDAYQALNACTSQYESFDTIFSPNSTNTGVATLASSLNLHTVAAGTATTSGKNTLPYGTTGGCPNVGMQGSGPVTVQVPTSLSIVAGTDSTSPEASCSAGTFGTGCGVTRSFVYQVNDQNGQPMHVAGLEVWDVLATTSPNNLNIGGYNTTCSPPNTGPCGVTTNASGQFQETPGLSVCSTVCRVNNACTRAGQTNATQTVHVGSSTITQNLVYYCDHITINGN